MKVKDIIEILQKMPDDYELCLSRFFSFPNDNPDESLDIILDLPITGIILNDDSKEARFIFSGEDAEFVRHNFGDIGVIIFSSLENESDTIN